jgi:hypothetical protein
MYQLVSRGTPTLVAPFRYLREWQRPSWARFGISNSWNSSWLSMNAA